MKGKVKWFSSEKGFGFIYGDDDVERFVHVRDIKGAELLGNGDFVSFVHNEGKKGPRATEVTIAAKAPAKSGHRDDRVACANCGRKMVPRMIMYNGEPRKSVCPFCGSTYKDFGWCFIATAVYGDYDAPSVRVLRDFRDSTLQSYSLGRIFIKRYYQHSPNFAQWLKKHRIIASIVRSALEGVVLVLRCCYKCVGLTRRCS